MSGQDEVLGFDENPAARLEAAFSVVAAGEMHTLPFYQEQIPVKAVGFARFEGEWLGVMLTPWTLSLLLLPGSVWPRRPLGERLGLALPFGHATFVVSELEGIGQYLSCSLLSPPTPGMSGEQAQQLALDLSRLVTALPVRDPDAPSDPTRRALFAPRGC